MTLADRVVALRPTAVNRVLQEARQLQVEGRTLVSLMRGQPDTPTPLHIVEAAEKAFNRGYRSSPRAPAAALLAAGAAASMIEQGQEQRALAYLAKIRQTDRSAREEPLVNFNYGLALWRLDRVEEALSPLEKAVEGWETQQTATPALKQAKTLLSSAASGKVSGRPLPARGVAHACDQTAYAWQAR